MQIWQETFKELKWILRKLESMILPRKLWIFGMQEFWN